VLIVSRENSDENEVLDRIVPRGYLFLGRTRIRMKVLDRIVSRGYLGRARTRIAQPNDA
jgi:hypothetical protein